jgi:DNA invertase Pin-like site-specific DNA recombinase
MTTDTNPTTVAVLYGAKSTADDNASIASQLAACRAHCEQRGWTVAGEFEDEAASAYTGSRGPGLIAAKDEAARLAAAGHDVALLVFATDRLARGDGSAKAAHLVEHVLDARKAGYRVEAVTEDLGGEMALLLAALYGERAHADSKAKGEHIKRGLKTAREQHGRYIGPRPPYGYRAEYRPEPGRDGKPRQVRHIVPDPTTAPWYLRIVEWTEAGAGCREVAARLNDAGVPSPLGGTWERSQVVSMLRSPVYKGCLQVWTREGNRRIQSELPGEHDGLIDADRWARLQELRAARTGRGRYPTGRHLLTGGLLRCPSCGAKMRARVTRKGYDYYACPNVGSRGGQTGRGRPCAQGNIAAAELDEQIAGHLLTVTFDPGEIAARVAAQTAALTTHAAQLHRQAAEKVKEYERRYAKVRDEYLGVMSREEWQEALDWLAARRDTAQAHADDLLDLAAAEERRAATLDAEGAVAAELEELRAALADREANGCGAIRERLARTFGAVYLQPMPGKPGRYMLHTATMTDAARERLAERVEDDRHADVLAPDRPAKQT